jgi:hypothetical protein
VDGGELAHRRYVAEFQYLDALADATLQQHLLQLDRIHRPVDDLGNVGAGDGHGPFGVCGSDLRDATVGRG